MFKVGDMVILKDNCFEIGIPSSFAGHRCKITDYTNNSRYEFRIYDYDYDRGRYWTVSSSNIDLDLSSLLESAE